MNFAPTPRRSLTAVPRNEALAWRRQHRRSIELRALQDIAWIVVGYLAVCSTLMYAALSA
jgi:hypothetical protein